VSPYDGTYPLSVANFNMIKNITRTEVREMKEIRNTHEQARALYTEIPEIIHTNISFCQDLMKYKFKSLIILSVPNRNPIPGKDISILFMCKSSLNIS
jgi:hypothetical protein